jgi:hypothetical protein
MICRCKSTFSMGMRRYIAGQEYDFDSATVERLKNLVTVVAPTETASSPASSEVNVADDVSENKALEKPAKDKMVKKSKTKKGKGK